MKNQNNDVPEIKVGFKFNQKIQAGRKEGIIKWVVPSVVVEITDTVIISELLEDCYDDILKQNYLNKGDRVNTVKECFLSFNSIK